jgi:hypothetical protein
VRENLFSISSQSMPGCAASAIFAASRPQGRARAFRLATVRQLLGADSITLTSITPKAVKSGNAAIIGPQPEMAAVIVG